MSSFITALQYNIGYIVPYRYKRHAVAAQTARSRCKFRYALFRDYRHTQASRLLESESVRIHLAMLIHMRGGMGGPNWYRGVVSGGKYICSFRRTFFTPATVHGVGEIKLHFAIFALFKESMTLNLTQRSSKVIDSGTNRKRVFIFILVVNRNLDPILHRFRDTAA